jgi:transposase
MALLAESVDGVIGVDTHRDTLAAAAVNRLGVDPSGRPPGLAPRATRWTRSGPPARRLAKTTWPPHGVGGSGRRCACC